ncbi:hypothetical protein [Desulfobulbus sp.]|uniref:hypothetical protein n=1 Tax=Desulfobulbus sp. TaxID=895 RepID=UPI00286F2677|nr:hypothetical protein [Desulfobulbus sp.]
MDFASLGNGQSTENTVVAGPARGYSKRLRPLARAGGIARKTTVEETMEIDWAYLRKG